MTNTLTHTAKLGFSGCSDGKESACRVKNLVLTPGLGRSPEEGNDNLFQYSCLENSMDRGASQATVHRIWGCKETPLSN